MGAQLQAVAWQGQGWCSLGGEVPVLSQPLPNGQEETVGEGCAAPATPPPNPFLDLLMGSGAQWGVGPGHVDGASGWAWGLVEVKVETHVKIGMKARLEMEAGSRLRIEGWGRSQKE